MAENEGQESDVRSATRGAFDIPELQAQAEAIAASVRGDSSLAEPPVTPVAQPAAPQGAAPESRVAPVQGASPEAQSALAPGAPAAEGTGEPATSYMGIDMADIPAEQRTAILGALQGQDKFIQKLMRREPVQFRAREASLQQEVTQTAQEVAERFQYQQNAQPGPEAPAETAAPYTDDDLLRAFDLDPDNPEFTPELKSAFLGLARQTVQTQTLVNSLYEDTLVDKTVQQWNTELDGLEKEYGDLPGEITRADLFEEAVKVGVSSPTDAYWRVVGPARKYATDEVKKVRAENLRAAKLQGGSGVRPQSSAQTEPKELTATTVRGATAEAARMAEEETGFTWKEALASEA